MIITIDILKAIAPGSKKTNYKLLSGLALWMNHWFPKFEIDSKGELCHFLAQAAHETDSFNSLEEYASGDAYDTRTDLGNTPQKDGDGRRNKGRGIFMVTGATNYRRATMSWNEQNKDDFHNFALYPEKLSKPEFAVWSACDYWDQRDFNTFANMEDEEKIYVKKLNRNLFPIEYITYRINGGFNHLKERKEFYERAKGIIK